MVSRKSASARAGASKPAARAAKPAASRGQNKVVQQRAAPAKRATDSKKKPPTCRPRQPSIIGRNLELLEGSRHSRRPSKLARAVSCFNATEVGWADEYTPPDGWEESEEMPVEAKPEDESWLPGPIKRPLPKFTGPQPGPTDASLSPASSVLHFLGTQITQEFAELVVKYTILHCEQWRGNNPSWRTDSREKVMKKPRKQFTSSEFKLWLACRLRIAQLQPDIPSYCLWNRHSSLFDVQVFNCMTFNQYEWINRHISFADVVPLATDEESSSDTSESDGELPADETGEAELVAEDDECSSDEEVVAPSPPPLCQGDAHRKRRELTELACKTFAAAWYPHQFVGVDEAVRSHKHWGRTRIRHKATVHSGSMVDCMNDCVTKYTLWFEEQHWYKKTAEQDPNTTSARLVRAAQQALCAPGATVSTGNYCVSLDRGYGHVQAQEELARMGVYSNAIMAANRVGLPRNYLAELATELQCPDIGDRKKAACTHRPDVETCRKFCFTALHKTSTAKESCASSVAGATWELSCWQDSKLIISYSNFFSSSRCGLLARGAHGDRHSYKVWAPEPIWHYNVQGRSATDGSDQLRKKMSIAERRIVRAGVKGISFVFDLAFTNAAIMWQFLHRTQVTRAELEKKYTKVPA